MGPIHIKLSRSLNPGDVEAFDTLAERVRESVGLECDSTTVGVGWKCPANESEHIIEAFIVLEGVQDKKVELRLREVSEGTYELLYKFRRVFDVPVNRDEVAQGIKAWIKEKID